MPDSLLVRRVDSVARVTLNRPDVRNAFNGELIGALDRTFRELDTDTTVRAVVLDGAGKVFSAGADIEWMRASLDLTQAENIADATRMSDMFRAIDRCRKPVIVKIHGAAIAGGAGLAAVADIAIASDESVFGFTETKLGIIPANISPFVLAKIGVTHARALFLTGERFGAQRAHAIGLIHEVVPAGELEARIDAVLTELAGASTSAIAAAKELVVAVAAASYDETREITPRMLAAARAGEDGQEGLRAFLERRPARWTR